MTRKVSPGLIEAIRLKRLPKRKPTDDDRPPPGAFLGPQPRHITGQLELADAERDAGGEEVWDDAA